MKKRTLVIGDIHGAYKALKQVLETAKVTESDQLIFLGDYVDGWSQSRQVIDHLIELNKTQTCLFIRGNHDAWCEEWLEIGNQDPFWMFHGGVLTISSYKGADAETKQKHLEFFQSMKNYHVDENNRLFIHAGFSSMHGPEKEKYNSNFSWDRTLWEVALTMDKKVEEDSKFYLQRLKLFKEIFIGHTPTTNYDIFDPMNAMNVWNVDTGAAFNGRLTVLDADTKEFWQSDVVQTLYPGENGRNKD